MSETRSQTTSGLGLEVVARVQADGLRRTEVLDREGNQLFQMTDCTEAGTEIAEGLVTMLNNWTSPPRTVNTAAELDALPDGTVVRDADGTIFERSPDGEGDNPWWHADDPYYSPDEIALPATVLFTPGEAG